MTEWTERHTKVVNFALHCFAREARERANAAAQDKSGEPGAAQKFLADARAAEEALTMIGGILPPS